VEHSARGVAVLPVKLIDALDLNGSNRSERQPIRLSARERERRERKGKERERVTQYVINLNYLTVGKPRQPMASPCPLLGDSITDDTLLHIARFLPTATDLLRLQLTCPRFAAKVFSSPSGGSGAVTAPENLSLPEEAARRWVAGCSEQERGWVPELF
jgi:hypothetical protein